MQSLSVITFRDRNAAQSSFSCFAAWLINQFLGLIFNKDGCVQLILFSDESVTHGL